MRSHLRLLVTLYVLLSLLHRNAAKRLGEGTTVGDTYAGVVEDNVDDLDDASRYLETHIHVTRAPTPKPDLHCMSIVDRPNKTFECGEPISIRFNYSNHDPPPTPPRIDDRLGIYPCYINITSFMKAEVWQWACGAPPKTPKTCPGTRSNGTVVFNMVPRYNLGGQVWPLTANYNKKLQLVNRCFRAVLMRNDRAPYSHVCHSDSFTVNENSKPGCKIRLTSPTDWF